MGKLSSKASKRRERAALERVAAVLAWCVFPVIPAGPLLLSECYWLDAVPQPRYASGLFKGIKMYF